MCVPPVTYCSEVDNPLQEQRGQECDDIEGDVLWEGYDHE